MRERTAWIFGGIAAALPMVGLLVWLNMDGDGTPDRIPSLPELPNAPSHPRLQVLEEPGSWKMETSITTFMPTNTIASSNTSQLDARWGLNGHCLFQEETVRWPSGDVTFNFTVKHYNATINRYHYTLIEDDGYVRGFIGKWQVGGARLEWERAFLPGAPPGVIQRITETQMAPGKREIHTEIKQAGKTLVTAFTRAERKGRAQTELPATPSTPELARLGRGGIWKESQSKTVAGQPETKQMTGRARWTPGGRALLYEGVIHSESEKEYFMWIKTYDREMKVYRSIHFHTDGPVDHYEGRWEEAAKTITWRSVQSPKNILIRETFVSPTHRNWRVEAYDDQGKTSDSIDGESKLEE